MYFVYELIDPRDGCPFYIGKGKRQRYLDHQREAMAGKRSTKCDQIRSLMRAGYEYTWRIVESFLNEQDAYDAEARLIEEHGLENLTNVMPGGGRAWEAYQRAKRSAKPDTAFDVVRKSRRNLLKAMMARKIGMKVKYGGVDLLEVACAVTDKLRDEVGDKYFHSYVPRFSIYEAA